jgi:hypothetical protein
MNSGEAADWIIERYPLDSLNSGEAMTVISHLSWKKPDQVRLAEYYLSALPFANSKPYEVFASLVPLYKLVDILAKYVPSDDWGKKLLGYHAKSILEGAVKTPKDRDALQSFIALLG